MDRTCKFDQGEACAALSEKFCPGCRFYKSGQAWLKGMVKQWNRLNTLPLEHQISIAAKYYKNKTPWRDKRRRKLWQE